MRKWCACAMVLVAAFVSSPGASHANASGDIAVKNDAFYSNEFLGAPNVLETDQATLTWEWDCGGQCSAPGHNVTAYSGASFASGDLADGATFTAPVGSLAAPIRYRCTHHSSFNSNGRCIGMCGVIVRRELNPPIAVVEQPSGQPVVGVGLTVPVTISGRAFDEVGLYKVDIRIYSGAAADWHSTTCTDCGFSPESSPGLNLDFTPVVRWSTTLDLLPGSYLVEATAYDIPRFVPGVSSRTQFTVI